MIKNIVLTLLLLGNFCLAQDSKISTIQVKGNASIKVVPDIFNWQVNVIADADDVQTAKRNTDASTSKVLDLLKSINVNSKDIKTSGISITKNKQPTGNVKRFTASNSIWFTLSDMSRYDELTTALTDIDNVYVNPVASDYSKAIEVRRQARTDALNAAKEKAEQMAEVYGLEIGRAITIVEGQFGWIPQPFNAVTIRGETNIGENTFSSGMINVTAEVTVTFELKEKSR